MKDATCEQKCAEGCLSRYHAYMKSCKRQCTACHEGSKEVCWDDCDQWKVCTVRSEQEECVVVDECATKKDSCQADKICHKWGTNCTMVDKCVSPTQTCEDVTQCTKNTTTCTPVETEACTTCREKSSGCRGLKAIKTRCNSDCDEWCSQSKDPSSCLSKCKEGCTTSQAAVQSLCDEQCSVCQESNTTQTNCESSCLKKEIKQVCTPHCLKTEPVKQCDKTCLQEAISDTQHCSKTCVEWKPKKQCKKKCAKWSFTNERPCHYPCKAHGFERVCDPDHEKCMAWSTGTKKCQSVGECISYEDMPPPLPPPPPAPAPSKPTMPWGINSAAHEKAVTVATKAHNRSHPVMPPSVASVEHELAIKASQKKNQTTTTKNQTKVLTPSPTQSMSDKLKELKIMGFEDDVDDRRALAQAGGVLSRAVKLLVHGIKVQKDKVEETKQATAEKKMEDAEPVRDGVYVVKNHTIVSENQTSDQEESDVHEETKVSKTVANNTSTVPVSFNSSNASLSHSSQSFANASLGEFLILASSEIESTRVSEDAYEETADGTEELHLTGKLKDVIHDASNAVADLLAVKSPGHPDDLPLTKERLEAADTSMEEVNDMLGEYDSHKRKRKRKRAIETEVPPTVESRRISKQAKPSMHAKLLKRPRAVEAVETASDTMVAHDHPVKAKTKAQKEAAKAKASLDASQKKLAEAMKALNEANEAVDVI